MKKIITLVMAIMILLAAVGTAEINLVQDMIVPAGTGYVWLGNVDCSHMTMRIDYPEYGVVESQNIRLELNDLSTVMLWHDASTRCAVFDVEYLNGEIYATGACGENPMILPEYVAGIKDTNHDGIMWCAIAGNIIPAGTRIRVWTEEFSEVE